MGRKSTINDRLIFAAAGAEIAHTGTLKLQSLSARTGASIGSLYHRFSSREGLLAAAWLDAVSRFQSVFLDALRPATLETGHRAALATPQFCRAEREASVILACCRQEEFLGSDTPHELAQQVARINDETRGELAAFADRVDRPLMNCRLALVAYPLAAVKLFLPDKDVPDEVDAEVVKAYRAALEPERS